MNTRTALKKNLSTSLLATSLVLLGTTGLADAAPGPGIGNIDCGDAEYLKPFTFLENSAGPKGTNVSVMIRGYFMTIFAPDSGLPPGEIAMYDLSDPRNPKEVKHIEGGDTNVFREAHSLPVALIGDKQYIAIQTTAGIQFWDFTDPLTASRVGSIDLPGVTGGDYENVAWQTSWQGRYLYVAGGNRGVYIVDAEDPTSPQLLAEIPTSVTGGFRVGPLFALGDYLVISNMDQGGAYAVLDISKPESPALLTQVNNQPRMYAIVVGGKDRIYSAGRDGDFLTLSFTDPSELSVVKNAKIGQDQLYAAAQDQFVFLGRQNNFVKVDVSDEQNPVVVAEGNLGRNNPDHGQVTPLGNLLFIGNDHGTGSALFCHQRGRDTTAPYVQSTYPKDGATGISPSARIGILFSDYINTDTILDGNVIIRPVDGEPLDGIFTYGFNTLSFGPNAPLSADTTYEVVLPVDGIADVMGNPLAEEVLLRFSTGDVIVVPPPEEPAPPTFGTGGTTIGSSGGSTGMGTGSGGVLFGAGGSTPTLETPATSDRSTNGSDNSGGCSVSAPRAVSGSGGLIALLAISFLSARRRTRRA